MRWPYILESPFPTVPWAPAQCHWGKERGSSWRVTDEWEQHREGERPPPNIYSLSCIQNKKMNNLPCNHFLICIKGINSDPSYLPRRVSVRVEWNHVEEPIGRSKAVVSIIGVHQKHGGLFQMQMVGSEIFIFQQAAQGSAMLPFFQPHFQKYQRKSDSKCKIVIFFYSRNVY